MPITKHLNMIQTKLNAPKNQHNKFGNYNYRNCEDILQALKPLLAECGCFVSISDSVQMVGDRIYIKAVATISDGENSISTEAFAREPVSKKGMDDAQLTGATSSYARKYALNGLFAIDDNKDADSHDNSQPDYEGICNYYAGVMEAANDGEQLKSAFKRAWGKLKGSQFQAAAKQVYDEQKRRLSVQ